MLSTLIFALPLLRICFTEYCLLHAWTPFVSLLLLEVSRSDMPGLIPLVLASPPREPLASVAIKWRRNFLELLGSMRQECEFERVCGPDRRGVLGHGD